MSISRADITRIIDLVSAGDVESLSSDDFAQFQYQGFDPLKIAQALLAVKTKTKMSDSDFKKDVYTMIAISLIKGSITPKNLEKMSADGKSAVTALNSKYGIAIGGGKGQASHVITYPRVMATFPDIAIRMVQVVGAKEFRGPMTSNLLPEYMKVQVFPAVIPQDLDAKIKKFLLMASLCYSVDQSIQISQIKEPDLKQIAADQSNFTMVGHNSPVPFDSVRKSIFKKLDGLAGHYSKIESVVKKYQELDPTYEIPTKTEFVTAISVYVSE